MFQTALGSGAPAAFPPAPVDPLLPSRETPSFATSRGRAADEAPLADCGVERDEAEEGLSRDLDVEPAAAGALLPRKVLLTDTDLKVAGFLMADEVLLCALSPSLEAVPSGLDASVSEPPLTLTSAEFTKSSTMSESCLPPISSEEAAPFTRGCDGSTSCESALMVMIFVGACGQQSGQQTAARPPTAQPPRQPGLGHAQPGPESKEQIGRAATGSREEGDGDHVQAR